MAGSRRLAAFVAFLALTVAGCGGQKTVSFGSATQPLLKNMIEAMKKNDTAVMDKNMTAAERFLGNKAMAQDEYNALKWAVEKAKSGKPKEAQEYLERCVAESKY